MHSFMLKLAKAMAILGGLVLSLVILIICASVTGRALNTALHSDLAQAVSPELANWFIGIGTGPITGDFELVEAGVAFAIFAFLPLCHITAGHATVEIFTDKLGAVINRWLRMVTEIVFAAVLILIAWRLYEGMMSKLGYGETTFLLQFPIWWAYAASLIGAIVAAIVGTYVAAVKTAEAFSGRDIILDDEGADI